jgi:alanine racemase
MSPLSANLNGIRSTRAIVDLDAIGDNVSALRRRLAATSQLMAVVKADAYGHGAPWVARAALEAGCSLLGVATVGEGAILRASGIDSRIVLLGSIGAEEATAACRNRLEITVGELALLEAVQRAARSPDLTDPVFVHLKIDTGLRRYGALPDEGLVLAERICGDSRLRFAGICTHFASADEPDEPFTAQQMGVFERVLSSLAGAGVSVPPRHAANSAGILAGRGTELEIARAGIAMYGIPPSPEVPLLAGMRPVMRIESRIARVLPIANGETVGYNRTFRANAPLRGALIPIGYADGYRRSLSNRGWVGIAGRRAPVLGRVSMDQTVVAIPEGTAARPGDIVQVLGDDAEGAPSALDLAELMDTNAYEVLVGIRRRVPRIFLRGGEAYAFRNECDDVAAGEC